MIEKLIKMDRETPKKILIVGDCMTDVYVHGYLEVGQEGCPKFVERDRTSCFGGASNAARSLKHWNNDVEWFYYEDQSKKTRFVVDGKVVFRHDDDKEANEFTTSDFNRIISYHPDAILISDYDKGFLSNKNIREIINYANDRKIPIVADAKREPSVYRGAITKGNADYVSKFHGFRVDTKWVATYGKDDPLTYGSKTRLELPPVHCVNHVGAGDCFAAHLTLALAHGISLNDAALIAHSAGRVYVQHPHNRAPYPHEVRKDYDGDKGKIVDFETLGDIRDSINGEIVFANGCFDLFGPHHLHLLQEAKKRGDILVVGVNSDNSVWQLKGSGRPVIPQEQRALLIAGLQCVDYVIVFDETTPARVMQELSPDIRVRAALDDVNKDGDEFATMVVEIAPLQGWSTTRTLTAIQNKPR